MIDAAYAGVRVAVLGASGFIGRWVARALSDRGARLALIVRDRGAGQRVADAYGIRGHIHTVDLTDSAAVAAALARVRPSIVFNLAGYGVDPAERDEWTMNQLNVELVKTLAALTGAVRDADWAGPELVHVGSALEYGEHPDGLSDDSATNPIGSYARTKLAATQWLARCGAETGLRAVTARLFTVYGPGELPGRLLPALLETALTRRPLSLTSGDQARDFGYVEDVVEGLVRLGVSPLAPGQIVNVATGRLTTVRAFAETAARVLGLPSGLLVFGARAPHPEEMRHGPVNIDRLRRTLDWVPAIDIEEGVRRTWAFQLARADTVGPQPGAG